MRSIWCSTKRRLLHGWTSPGPVPEPAWWQRLLGIEPHGGTIFELEELPLESAQRALQSFLTSPGAFSIVTAEGNRIEFLTRRGSRYVTLDCWLETEDEIDAARILSEDASDLLERIFTTSSDEVIVSHIRKLETRAA